MKEITATDAARRFSDVLDAVEHKAATFVVVRNGKVIAEIGPAHRSTGKELIEFLKRHKPDLDWAREIAHVRGLLVTEERRWDD